MRTSSRFPARLLAVALMALLLPFAAAPLSQAANGSSSSPSPTAAASQAATAHPTADNGELTFGIGPALPVPSTQEVDGRAYLKYLASPGANLSDAVALLNYGTKPLRLQVYATDAVQAADGTFGLLPRATKPTGAGSWIKLKTPKSGIVTVPPKVGRKVGRLLVPFTAHIPSNATPGDHVAGVIASLRAVGKNKSGARVTLDQRIGLRTYFHLSGRLVPKLAISGLQASYTAHRDPRGRGTVTVSYVVRNTGNVIMNASQTLELKPTFGKSVVQWPTSLTGILPGSKLYVRTQVNGVLGLGKVRVTATIFPTPTDPTVSSVRGFVQAQVTIWAISWVLVGIIVVLLLLAFFGGNLWWRRRRRRTRLRAVEGKGKKGASSKQPTLQRRLGESMAARTASRLILGVVAAGTAAAFFAPVAQAAPPSSPWQIFTETTTKANDPQGGYSGAQANAIIDGWWGHEDPHDGPTLFSGANFNSPDFFKTFGLAPGDYEHIGVAFVPASSDGSTEHPVVHRGELAGQAFKWFTTVPMFGNWTANIVGVDSVATVSTQAEWDAWVGAGSPSVDYNAHLQQMLPLVPGTPLAPYPSGASVLRRWAPGQKLSMVYFTIAGFDSHTEPIVKVGPDGHALTAWMTFTTVASPSKPRLEPSAGYHVVDPPAGFAVNTVARDHGKPLPEPGASAAPSPGATASAGSPSTGGSSSRSSGTVKQGAGSASAAGGGTTTTSTGRTGATDTATPRSPRGGGLISPGSVLGGGLTAVLLLVAAVVLIRRFSRRRTPHSAAEAAQTPDPDGSLSGR